MRYETYEDIIESLDYSTTTLLDLNNLVEEMANDDDITDSEYCELYGMTLKLIQG